MTRKRKLALVLSLAVALLVFAVVGSIFLPKLLGSKKRTGDIPRLTQVGNSTCPKSISPYTLYNAAYGKEIYLVEDGAAAENQRSPAGKDEYLRQIADQTLIDPDFPCSINDFARDSIEPLSQQFSINSCYAPISLYYALALAGSGAEGKTKTEFQNVLSEKEDGWAAEQCGKFYRQHYRVEDDYCFQLANSLWLDGRINFRQEYISNAEKNFYSDLFRADFTDPTIGDHAKQWVSEHTNGLLSPKFEFSPDSMLSIINTVYYNAQWKEPFLERLTTTKDFYRADGSAVAVDFLQQGCNGSAYEGDGFTRASLSLSNDDEMIFILPDEGVSPKALLRDPAAFEDMFYPKRQDALIPCLVYWEIPKFQFQNDYDLISVLQNMGLHQATNAVSANFSGMSDLPLYISGGKHGTSVGIDEKGVEAAAYSALTMAIGGSGGSPDRRIEMILNRPFLFAITTDSFTENQGHEGAGQESLNSTLLFVGVCGDPTAK